MINQDKKNNEREIEADREFAAFVKESRRNVALHNYIGVAAKSYIDGMKAALRCMAAAQSATV